MQSESIQNHAFYTGQDWILKFNVTYHYSEKTFEETAVF